MDEGTSFCLVDCPVMVTNSEFDFRHETDAATHMISSQSVQLCVVPHLQLTLLPLHPQTIQYTPGCPPGTHGKTLLHGFKSTVLLCIVPHL